MILNYHMSIDRKLAAIVFTDIVGYNDNRLVAWTPVNNSVENYDIIF